MEKKTVLTASILAVLTIATPFVMPLEGRTLVSYFDVNGVPTICNGITKGVEMGQTRTNAECDELIKHELGDAVAAVDARVKVPLSLWQRAGLASFVYNVGETKFAKSTILVKLNENEIPAACDEMLRWVYVGGKDCRLAASNCSGIVRRRKEERAMCLKAE